MCIHAWNPLACNNRLPSPRLIFNQLIKEGPATELYGYGFCACLHLVLSACIAFILRHLSTTTLSGIAIWSLLSLVIGVYWTTHSTSRMNAVCDALRLKRSKQWESLLDVRITWMSSALLAVSRSCGCSLCSNFYPLTSREYLLVTDNETIRLGMYYVM